MLLNAVSAKVKTSIEFHSALVTRIALFIMIAVVSTGTALAATTHYIAANGSDSNNGTSTSTPWLHAPGMSTCTGSCASYTPAAGDQFIFRGGDTWHFGNSGATPYTGGTWTWTWSGTSAQCDTSDNPAAVRTSCIYIGVDTNWSAGSTWTRPIMSGDNPTSTTAVSSCAHTVGTNNDFLIVNDDAFSVFDNFEWTGMCQSIVQSASNNYGNGQNIYITDNGSGSVQTQNVYENNYFHGTTHVPYSCSEPGGGEPVGVCYNEAALSGRINASSTLGPGNVCDGWDSDPSSVGCILWGPSYLVYGNVFANFAQIVVNGYHDWHDNYFFNYHPTSDGFAHGNSFESNNDAPGADNEGHSQPNVPFNVFYNNILGHNAAGTSGDVKLWFCPNDTAAEYYFNNIVYDQGPGNNWDIACAGKAGQFMFNNTLDVPSAGALNCVSTQTVKGNHEIVDGGSAFASGSCSISNEVQMTHATAVSQGYMAAGTGMSGSNSNTTCANDMTPCAPTSATNATVNPSGGANLQGYCSTLQGANTADGGDIVRAGGACQYATTDTCTYDTSTRSVSCPRAPAVERPGSSIWAAGAYQFTAGPNAPTGLTATVQ
jgi:hypothetical protein